MELETQIQKWGNGLALRVAGVMREVPDFQEGTPVMVTVHETGFTVTKIDKKKIFLKEADILKGLTAHTAHADEMASLLPSEIL